MVEIEQKRYADDITVQELVRLRVENEKQRDEIVRLREALHNIYRKTSDDHIMQMVDDALQQKESE